MSLPQWMMLAIIIIGHFGIWCALFNQVHATAWPRPTRKLIEKAMYIVVLCMLVLILGHAIQHKSSLSRAPLLFAYEISCLSAAFFLIARWAYRKLTAKSPSTLVDHTIEIVNFRPNFSRLPVCGFQANTLIRFPGNQVLQLAIERKTISVERLPQAFEGINIAHLSDIHLTGKIGKPYFEEVAKQCNLLNPDLVFLTGDVVDKEHCIDWLPDVLGQIKSKHGCYYILGNHDRRVQDTDHLRKKIGETGFVPAVGQWNPVSIGGQSIWLLGNETPWFKGSSDLPESTDDPNAVTAMSPNSVRILLAHTPDQISWAVKNSFDLMFAGHCHGGQIRIPGIGPIVSPSRYGVRFASGVFQVRETTMLVTRGISSDDPIRLNCRPELSLVKLVGSQYRGNTQTGSLPASGNEETPPRS